MVDTNQLLSIAFSLISGFTNVVHVPSDGVPRNRGDLQKLVVGGLWSPFDLVLVHRHGETFWIRGGIVESYESPVSFFHSQTVDTPEQLKGPPALSSNQVVNLGLDLLRRLGKTGNPAEKIVPKVKSAEPNAPFYKIVWSLSDDPLIAPAAEVEIDARDGRVAFMYLWAKEYHDLAFAREISNRVYTAPAPPRPKPPKKPGQDQWTPTTNEVQTLVPRWLNFCKRLGLDPGNQTNVADVDWEPTFKAKATPPATGLGYKIQFRNGYSFNCEGQMVTGHKGGDAAFVGPWADQPPDYWTNFVGKSTRKWQDLAADLNARLIGLGVSSNHLGQYTPDIDLSGTGGVNRCVVYWYESKSLAKKMDKDRIKTGLLAEFDLATGQIKNLLIFDFNLLKWEDPPEPKEK